MNKKKKKRNKDLHQQAYDKLCSMCAFGRSKIEDKKAGIMQDKIYSYSTFKNYWEHIKVFVIYVKKNHSECTKIKDARKYVKEWLECRVSKEYSAWTINKEAKALGKLYQITPEDKDYFKCPTRRKEDIKRSRDKDGKYNERFNEVKYEELVHFCKHTGLRKDKCLTKIESDSLYGVDDIDKEIIRLEKELANEENEKLLIALYDTKLFEEKWFIKVKGKGGRIRFAPILNNDERVINKIKNTYPGNKVWPSKQIRNNFDCHGCRRSYAQALYCKYAHDINSMPKFYEDSKGNVHLTRYFKRGKDKGTVLDKQTLSLVATALGHGKDRFTTVADNYL